MGQRKKILKFELNYNENTSYQNLWDAKKVLLFKFLLFLIVKTS